MSTTSHADLLCCGDFNLTEVCWKSEPDKNPMKITKTQTIIAQSTALLNMVQFNEIPNMSGVLLDLVFSSLENMVVSLATDILVPCDGHHPALCFHIDSGNLKMIDQSYSFLDFKNANYNELLEYLSRVNWNEVILDDDVQKSVSNFYSVLNSGIELYVPRRITKKYNFPNWFSPRLKGLIYSKKAAHKLFKKSNSRIDYLEFANLRNLCRIESESCYREHINSIEESIESDPKFFWRFINDSKVNKGFPSTMYYENEISEDPKEIAEFFGSFFSEVYMVSKPRNFVNITQDHQVDIGNILFSQNEVLLELLTLRESNDSGMDNIASIFLKRCADVLSEPLCNLFNISLSKGIYPKVWKNNFIIPIHKSGDVKNVKNYRPILKCSHIPKLFDKLLHLKISPHFSSVLMAEQHGFISKRSVTTNLVSYIDIISKAMLEKFQVDSIYTDFKKAFDVVPHWLLIEKLKGLGVGPPLLDWLADRLHECNYRVKIGDNIISGLIAVLSGVGQGSPLSTVFMLH